MEKKTFVLLASAVLLTSAIRQSYAACPATGNQYVCDNQTNAMLGVGAKTNNVDITINQNATLNGGNTPAISVGDNNVINVSGTVTNSPGGNRGGFSGYPGTGPNTIEAQNNTVINIDKSGKVIVNGNNNMAEAINVMGYGNTIVNNGVISASATAAIWFQDTQSGTRNNVVNYGVIQRPGGGNVIGTSGGNGIRFENNTGGRVEGDLQFSRGDDDLFFYAGSEVTGNINGGGGTNNLTLDGQQGSLDSLRGDIKNFTTLTKSGLGRWDASGSLEGFTRVAVDQGILGLSGNNDGFSGQLIINPDGNNDADATVEARAQSLPTNSPKTGNTENVINNGMLILAQPDDSRYVGQIVGSGQVIKQGDGLLTLAPEAMDGNTYSGGTTIKQGTIAIADDSALGATSGALTFDGGVLTINNALDLSAQRSVTIATGGGTFNTNGHDSTLAQAIGGNGEFTKAGEGVLTLAGQNTYSGNTVIAAGNLNVTGGISGPVMVQQNTQLSGTGQVGATTIASGGLLTVGDIASTTAPVSSQFTVNGNLSNDGTIQLNRDATTQGSQLNIAGDYTGGSDSLLLMNGVLAGDDSPADRVNIAGSTDGSTGVSVTNLGGIGASVINGIELIDVKGHSSSAAFYQKGRIVAGLYDYSLVQKGNNWYLTNHYTGPVIPPEKPPVTPPVTTDPGTPPVLPVEPGKPVTPPVTTDPGTPPVPPVKPGKPVTPPVTTDPGKPPVPPVKPGKQITPPVTTDPGKPPVPPVKPPVTTDHPGNPLVTPPINPGKPIAPLVSTPKTLRPEIGGYIANLTAANTLFNLTLDDREGGTEYLDPVTGQRRYSKLWLRQEGGQTRFNSGSNQLKTQANRYVVQLGDELIHGAFGDLDRWDVGIMAGYANQHANTDSSLTGYRSQSEINGYSTGLYGTWFENAQAKTGLYADSWIQYSWFNNEVDGKDQAKASYKSRGFTASLETGYIASLAQFQHSELYVQPQAQAIWMGVKNHTYTEDNGTHVQDIGNDNLQTRLGVRLYLKGHSSQDEGKQREFKPYVEANWIHNSQQYGVRMDGEEVSMSGTRNVGQLKLGVQGQLTPALNLWGGTAVDIGDAGYSDASAMLGVKYQF
ncbi:MAG: autotransporter outer membrane beta-barrel domain-containing protein [Kluyvera sp.]|uniref:autotransporter outer membrane beta-barrel domain-containing protein n=1 Tax=Kluyvera sp. TaxID=1538228 RepID=UPI003F301A35